jgi:heme A synthase
MGGYVIAIFAGAFLVSKPPRPDAAHLATAIIPLVPLCLALTEVYYGVRAMDELQRRIHTEALLLSLLGTVAIVLSVGLLQFMAGIPLFSVFSLFVPICLLYALGVFIGRRRYS